MFKDATSSESEGLYEKDKDNIWNNFWCNN